jgi:uncharacterized membrane protein
MKKFIRNVFGALLYGLAFWFPIIIVFFVLTFLYDRVEEVGRKILLVFLPENYVQAGYGALLGLLIIYISGVILKMAGVRRWLSRIPVIGLLFGGGEVITVDRLVHLTPCLFMMSPTCLSYGWLLSEENVKLDKDDAPFVLVNVYYPNVPTLVTGQVFPVRKDTVIRLGNPSKEIIDLLLYSFRSPNALIYLPWDGESPEDFQKRAASVGLNLTTVDPGPILS